MRNFNILIAGLLLTASTAWAESAHEPVSSDATHRSSLLDLDIPDMVEIHVRPGESLYDIARWSEVRMEALEQLNGIDLAHGLQGGQALVIPMTQAVQTQFVQSRTSFHDRRKTRYLQRRGGLSEVREYRVRTGDTVWNIAKEHGDIPLWLVKAYNPETDLNRVRIGDILSVPIVEDSVDTLDEESIDTDESAHLDDEFEDIGC